jgi:glycosyltransferase involved in cell wall biosynthesis
MNSEPLVSIVTPCFNVEIYITRTIECILSQSYSNWELLLVDDKSTDATMQIIQDYLLKDSRLKLIRLEKNSGPAVARQTGIDNAKGEYVAFCDSDDLWEPEKLSIQISFMLNQSLEFSCTAYAQISEDEQPNGKVIHPQERANYKTVLKSCPIGNSTVIVAKNLIEQVRIPNIRKRNDYVLWLTLLKKTPYCYGIDEVLVKYRLRSDGISNNKVSLVKYHWYIYRKIEKLSFIYSCYLIMNWVVLKVFRIKP